MYNEINSNPTYRAHGAREIELHARETEKKMALQNLVDHTGSTGSGEGILSKAARRIASLIAALF